VSTLDRRRIGELHRGARGIKRTESPIDTLNLAAVLLETLPASSEARACADRLRRMARAMAAALKADQAFNKERT
jgi:hypothetical protein